MHDVDMGQDLMLHAWDDLTATQAHRWSHVLDTLVNALSGVQSVVIDSHHPAAAAVFADRLAFTAHQQGRHCVRLTAADEDTWHAERIPTTLAVADGHIWRNHPISQASPVIWLRAREPLDQTPLASALHATGWHLTTYDDPPHRFLAIATRA
jgi:hypothetical protein